jgi:hypothetical protein
MTKLTFEQKCDAHEKVFREKLDELIERGEVPVLKPNCKFENGTILMECVCCKEWKERTYRNFCPGNGLEQVLKADVGCENFANRLKQPCRKCYAKQQMVASETTEAAQLIRPLKNYREDGLDESWYHKQFARQNGCCWITGLPISLLGFDFDFKVGIHRKNNQKDHTKTNSCLEIQELNVAQYEAIPDLKEAWIQGIREKLRFDDHNDSHCAFFEFAFNQSRVDLGIYGEDESAEANEGHLPTILDVMIRKHIQRDIEKGRMLPIDRNNMPKFLESALLSCFEQLRSQKFRCAYSNNKLTVHNGPSRFSIDRFDDDIAHFSQDGRLQNGCFVWRIYNGAGRGLTKEKFLMICLKQPHVKLSRQQREKLEDELAQERLNPHCKRPFTKKQKRKLSVLSESVD